MHPPSIGSVFAGHRLEAILGTGGMGVVYLATHERLKRRRAVKVISPELSKDEQFRRRFERESELAASIEHPHVTPIYDAGEDHGQLYIAMRYIEGTDMSKLIRRRGQLDPRFTARIVGQVAAALDAAHEHGLVHRDVKPANILIASADDQADAFLTDFGLTKVVDSQSSALTETGKFVGTLDYIAPEQLSGAASPSADIYSLGCLTFEALTGEVPYQQEAPPAKMWAHINAEPPRLENATAQLAETLARAMAKRPEDRFPTAGEFAGALGEAIEAMAPRRAPSTEDAGAPPTDPPITARPSQPGGPPGPESPALDLSGSRRTGLSRRSAVTAAVIAVLIASAVGGVIAMSSGGGGESKSSDTTEPAAGGIRIRPTAFGVPGATETVDDAARRFGRAVKQLDGRDVGARQCAAVRSYVEIGVLKCTSEEKCRPPARGVRTCTHVTDYVAYPDFRVVKKGTFGSAGVIEFTDRQRRYPNTYNLFVALDKDGLYRPTGPKLKKLPHVSLGTKPGAWATADAAAKRFLNALRSGSCHSFWKVAFTPGSFNNENKACRALLLGRYSRAASVLRETPASEINVFRLGGTEDFYFYGIRAQGQYRTLVFVKSKKNYVWSLYPPGHGRG